MYPLSIPISFCLPSFSAMLHSENRKNIEGKVLSELLISLFLLLIFIFSFHEYRFKSRLSFTLHPTEQKAFVCVSHWVSRFLVTQWICDVHNVLSSTALLREYVHYYKRSKWLRSPWLLKACAPVHDT